MTSAALASTADIMDDMENEKYQRVIKSRDRIIALLRKKGYRITHQRELLLDVIYENECLSCKEIYYQAIKKDPTIGMATIYRMINILTDIGVLSVSSIKPHVEEGPGNGCIILFENNESVNLTRAEWIDMLEHALWKKGINPSRNISKVIIR